MARIHGVACTITGAPVPDLEVTCRDPAGVRIGSAAISGADGTFALVAPPTNAWLIGVDSPMWTAVLEPQSFGPNPDAGVVLVVAQAADLRGLVVDGLGVPVANAEVRLLVRTPLRTRLPKAADRSGDVTWQTRTGADGTFGIPSAPALQVEVKARSEQHGEAAVTIAPPFPVVHLQFAAGQGSPILDGIVRLRNGAPATAAVVGLGELAMRVDGQGRFSMDLRNVFLLPDQLPVLRAGATGYVPAEVSPIDTDWRRRTSWPADLVLELGEPALQISGCTVDGDGNPLDCDVDIQERSLWPEQRVPPLGLLSPAPQTGKPRRAGAFCVERLTKGSHRLRVIDKESQQVLVTGPIDAGSLDCRIVLPRVESWPATVCQIVDREGHPVANARWMVEGPSADAPDRRVQGAVAQTGPDGVIRLARIARTMDTLAVGTEGVHMFKRWRLEDLKKSTNLRLAITTLVDAVVEIRAAAPNIDGAVLVDADGNTCELVLTNGAIAYAATRLLVVDGRTRPFRCPDDAAAIVLFVGDREAWRAPVALGIRGTNVIRP